MFYLAGLSALITVGFGLTCLIAPRYSLKLIHLQTKPSHPEAVAEGRGTLAGFYLGVGLLCLMAPSAGAYWALALGWLFTGSGRGISMVLDNGRTRFNTGSILFEFGLGVAALPAALVLS
tara:strand:+ start:307 stop:666 length:360 start_codon:yes stop_codon:yes gene_type:complete